MTPAQEHVVKMLIGVVMLSALSAAGYLVGRFVLWLFPSNNALAALSALAFSFVGFVYAMSWIKRQSSQWWNS